MFRTNRTESRKDESAEQFKILSHQLKAYSPQEMVCPHENNNNNNNNNKKCLKIEYFD